MSRKRLVRSAAVVALMTTCVVFSGGCCSRYKEKAKEYKAERDRYERKLARSRAHAQQLNAQLVQLQKYLQQQGARQRAQNDVDAALSILKLLL